MKLTRTQSLESMDVERIIVPENSRPTDEQISALAYELWEARGCPEGSPELDWQRAEQELSRAERLSHLTAA